MHVPLGDGKGMVPGISGKLMSVGSFTEPGNNTSTPEQGQNHGHMEERINLNLQ